MKMPALILVVVAIILPLAPANSQDGANPPAKEQIEASAQKIKDLQKERIATLEKVVDQLAKLAQNGRAEFGETMEARLLLLQAKLDAAEKGADRISLYKEAIDSLKKYEEWADARVQAARATEATVLKIKARRLEVEIQLEQAKVKEAKGGK